MEKIMFYKGSNGKYRAGKRITRRGFMKGAGAAGLSFTIMKPSSVRGTEANSRVEVGCIGLGGRGSLIAGMLKEHKGYEITSLADYFPGVSTEGGEKFGVAEKRCFSGLSGYQKLIGSKVDAVFCETPPYCFGEHVTAAVNAGCHVYLAKPVACDVPGCLTIAEMGRKATQTKKVFLVDFQMPTDPFIIEAVRRVHDGDIGPAGMMSSFYTDDGFRDPPKTETIESRLRNLIWVNDVELGGGMIVNADIHAIDAALWIAGARPVSAMGCSRVGKSDAHGDTAYVYSLTYQFENGLIMNHQGEHLRNTKGFSCGCFAYGTEGYLEANYQGKAWVHGNKESYRGGEVTNLYVEGIKRNLDKFYNSIVGGIYDNPTVETSVNSTLATILGRQAARRNTRVTWDEMIRENEKIEVNLTGLKA
ncbi:MAG TPA: Gfo/Idh/MocA family oxidoreductase [Sedimentisphaerales bacterium]|nr:Gfo/Idh/MocA family oxidoreductase [Sedimentisphaerales bacterium]